MTVHPVEGQRAAPPPQPRAARPAAEPDRHSAPPDPPHPGSLAYIPALDGVRAFAVLSVMAFHFGVGWLSGGFLGVDTFFVLSGFLITALLIGEWSSTATIKLGAFWARRARRLLPALLLMLLFVAAFAYFVAPAGTYPSLRGDAVFTLFYSANWHFIAAGADYFTATGQPSPLTHTWSLAVEEQFYLVWPLVVLGVVKLTRSWVPARARARHRAGGARGNGAGEITATDRAEGRTLGVLLVVCVAGVVASAVAMARLYDGTNQTRLYYGTDTHAQCILIGATLAVVTAIVGHRRGIRGTVPVARSVGARLALSLAGAAGVVTTAVLWATVDGQSSWLYHVGFVVASVATAAVLASVVCVPKGLLARALGTQPLRYLGKISYGLYLWHFPLFLYLDHQRTDLSGWSLVVARYAVTLAVASASFYLVERPIRQGTFFHRKGALAVAPAAVGAVAAVMVLATAPVAGGANLAQPSAAALHAAKAHHPAETFPFPAGVKNLLLVGDSMAYTLGNGMELKIGWHYGINTIDQGQPNCSLAEGVFRVENYAPRTSAPPCQPGSGAPAWPQLWTQLVDTYRPQVSMFVARLDIVDRLYGGTWTHIGDPAYDAYLEGQLRTAVEVLTSKGGKVVLLTSPYYDTGEQPDGQPWPEDDPARVDQYNAMLRRVAAEYPGKVSIFDLNKLVDPAGHYQPVIDGVQVRFTDGIHFTADGDCWLVPRLLPLVDHLANTGVWPDAAQARSLVHQAVATMPPGLCSTGAR